jgi:hypothetical protein
MCRGNGIVAGSTAEPGMGGMPEFERVDIDTGVNRLLVAMARDASGILAHSVTECCRFPRMGCRGDPGEKQHQQQRQYR